MTNLERKILTLLQENARASTAELAAMVGVSESQVKKSMAKMEKDGVILRYMAVVNERKITADKQMAKVRALVEVRVRPERNTGYDAIAKRMARHKNVIEQYLISGNYDFLVIVEGDSLEEISSFVSDKLASMESVVSTATHFIMRKYKEKGILIDKPEQPERLLVTP